MTTRSSPAFPCNALYADAGLLLACGVFLYANLFAGRGTPFLLGGDQVFLWMDAQRLAFGERLYEDFFQFTPPGADWIYLGAFGLLGRHIWTPNLIVLGLGLALGAVCLRISRLILARGQAALATSLYVVFVVGGTLDGTHHWFSLLVVMGAVCVLMEGRTTARIAVAGVLLGVATFITQTRGPAAASGIAAWLLWERFRAQEPWMNLVRQQALLFAGMILAWGALSAYYIGTIGLSELWFLQVTYVRECAVSGLRGLFEGPRGGLLPAVRWAFAYLLLPVVYGVCLWKCWRNSRVCLLTLVATALFLEVAQSPSWFRFYCVSLPAVILLLWLTERLGRLRIAAWVAVIGLAAQHTWSMHVHYSTILELPAGRVAAPAPAAEKLAWLAEHTGPGQFMLQAGWPGMYLPLDLRNPVFLDVIPGCSSPTRLGYVELSMRQLDNRRVHYIVWSPQFESPGYASPPQFHQFLVDRYRLIRRFSDRDEIWERK